MARLLDLASSRVKDRRIRFTLEKTQVHRLHLLPGATAMSGSTVALMWARALIYVGDAHGFDG